MARNPVPPKNCGGEKKQGPGRQASAGTGSGWDAQCAPPSRVTRRASAREKQALVSQPLVLVAKPMLVLSQAAGSPLGLAPAWFHRGLAAVSDQVLPPSLVWYSC